MREPQGWTDEGMEQVMGNLLRAGVLLAAAVVLAGGVVFLARHGGDTADHHTFHGVDAVLKSPVGIVRESASLSGRGLIQLGLLLLIATPVARVVFSAYAFFREGDWVYVAVTLVVLAVLLFSLFGGYLEQAAG